MKPPNILNRHINMPAIDDAAYLYFKIMARGTSACSRHPDIALQQKCP